MDQSRKIRISGAEPKRRMIERRLRTSMKLMAWASVAVVRLAFADPAPESAASCASATPGEAKALADRLYENGEYQRAGECYDVAGDPMRAQRAFLRAAGPNAAAAARGLKEEGHTAKGLFAQVEQAFRSNH